MDLLHYKFSELRQDEKADFLTLWKLMQESVYEINLSHGFESASQNKAEKIALIHSELSEALESLRHDDPPSDHIPKFTGVEEELADAVIRIMNFARHNGYRVGEAILAKSEFNDARPFKHGNKVF